MNSCENLFYDLRAKLDAMGYRQQLTLAAVPLVFAMLEDFVKTTESLRDSKTQIAELLDEQACWVLNTEPYKCDNARLLNECNQLHMQLINEREKFEQRINELSCTIRNLQKDKLLLQEHCEQLQRELKIQQSTSQKKSVASNAIRSASLSDVSKKKKPFVSAVRSGELFSSEMSASNTPSATLLRCSKCNSGFYQRMPTVGTEAAKTTNQEVESLYASIENLNDQLSCLKRKVETRDREIMRLNELLSGGRPPKSLARDCCYTEIKNLQESLKDLESERQLYLKKAQSLEQEMHKAMKNAMRLEETNDRLNIEMSELRQMAVDMETEVNVEMKRKNAEINRLQNQLNHLQNRHATLVDASTNTAASITNCSDRLALVQRITELTRQKCDIMQTNENLMRKVHKYKTKVQDMEKELKDMNNHRYDSLDEEKMRIKSERDFFQKEYLRMLNKAGSEQEVQFLMAQVKSKDEELRELRSELYLKHSKQQACNSEEAAVETVSSSNATTARSHTSNSSSDCVQSLVNRIERERDCVRAELERVRAERDTLRAKHLCIKQLRAEECQKHNQDIDRLKEEIKELQIAKRELDMALMPTETQIELMKEQIEELNKRLNQLQDENRQLTASKAQMRILQAQTERSLSEMQNKLINAQSRITASSALDSHHESTQIVVDQLKKEIAALKQTYVELENEKDRLLMQLDAKTETICILETENTERKQSCDALEKQVKCLEEQLKKLTLRSRSHEKQLRDKSDVNINLVNYNEALQCSRDNAVGENFCLVDQVTKLEAENCQLKKSLHEVESEVLRLKQLLHTYVQEVKKAEDLLCEKEKEREEMLEHYRSLSHDAVTLEGTNQSLEYAASEYKCQVDELEREVKSYQQRLKKQEAIIEDLEAKITALKKQVCELENEKTEALEAQQILQEDLAACKDLCSKLDNQKDKLNAEVAELHEIRRKLERDLRQIRDEAANVNIEDDSTYKTLQELLSRTRADLEQQLVLEQKLAVEIASMKRQNAELLEQLHKEQEKCQSANSMAHEYFVQNQELRHNITDDRFRLARSREESPNSNNLHTL